MAIQMRSYGRGLRMPLLALTASASIVGGVFVAAQPAYSVDGVAGVGGQCLTAAEEGGVHRRFVGCPCRFSAACGGFWLGRQF